jgi:hypothetical protein|tara:strand:- start:2019 stop:2954 length:936 start_codon:yes stop_codon:yes gene_type:complete
MNNNLAISIPTYNRPSILKSNLINIIDQAREFDIPIHISDDSNNEETKIVIEEYMKDYDLLFYIQNTPSLGHDRNIVSCLSNKESEYIWLMGDSMSVTNNAIKKILDIIQQESPNIISCGAENRNLGIDSSHIYDKDYILEKFGWHNTLTGTTIYSKNALNFVQDLDLLECKNFPQISIIFKALNKKCSFYWENKPLIYAHKEKESYWQNNIFETFIDDFSRVVFYLPPEYSNHLKSKVIPIHSKRAKIFDLKSLLVLRAEGIFDFQRFKKYYKTFKNNSSTNLVLIFMISVIPKSILIPIRAFNKNSYKK